MDSEAEPQHRTTHKPLASADAKSGRAIELRKAGGVEAALAPVTGPEGAWVNVCSEIQCD